MMKKLTSVMASFALVSLLAANAFAMEVPQGPSGIMLQEGLFLYESTAEQTLAKFALIVHGFNAKPELMEPAIEKLTAIGIPTILVALSGHRPNSTMSLANWQNDVKAAVGFAKEMANGSEIIVIGHSLGGALVSHELASNETDAENIKMVLLAPANGLMKLSNLAPLLKTFIPTINPESSNLEIVRGVKDFLSMPQNIFIKAILEPNLGTLICRGNAYSPSLKIEYVEALIEASDLSSSTDFRENLILSGVPTLVIIDNLDTLVSPANLETIFGNTSMVTMVRLDKASDSVLAHTFQSDHLITHVIELVVSFISKK